ncbi:hypothetical protein B0T14DRAFT_76505 [Immersiella caudata]|uniref:Uncharacterized protein n=1 Tax=Immersiella caudata TaxID=314043 RepID=A0AA39XGM6_9PEZI|nr:hypothetical protein B0T14DRAFT_76505 [Immersiella caudata]
MKCTSLLCLFVAGLASSRAVASSDGDAIRAGEHFRMAFLAPRQTVPVRNLQVFTGSLGGVSASAITNTGDPQRQFGVDGDTFNDFGTAANRACDNQFNACADIANAKQGNFAVGDCDRQKDSCKAALDSTPTKSFPLPVLVSQTAEFDIFCDA